ncbi:erythronate-4-phosphate dehydrogenase [Hahella sp. CCB-MM4]|uniref:4-phosphoerythronate dehydrogenase PdxB n=1 Tax=Hahella sp. (strain CCB-MM4) TaxID=1926491 RepID=UPI000B9A8ED4|nr:4-phosphoerythronate dehydrogenase PdxB [Hahella sp. CCB-MM4]OZG73726.1 erythronate-4-phosphate dehydrogenase [Hahella sp. CCB-MM4]
MKIVADENIPLVPQFFASIGEIQTYPGRGITPEHVRDADILLVRSITQVNRQLLEGSRVRFVGTTTIGLDHVDTEYLNECGIAYSNAPGCNASAVVEYVVGTLSVLADELGFELESKSVGIIGRGAIGSKLEKALTSLGMKVLSNDPPKENEGEEGLYPLEEVLQCDVISLHVPLVEEGEYQTHHLMNHQVLSGLRGDQILINSSRGDVIDEAALKQRLQEENPPTVVLDVFNGEPVVDTELADLCHFVTPHIAGYTLDGKVAGTEMVYKSFCRYLGLPERHKLGQFLPEPPLKKLAFSSGADPFWALHTAIRTCYDVRHDDSNLRRTLRLPEAERGKAFDELRKGYRVRRGFEQVKVVLKGGKVELLNKLSAVGFNIQSK